MAPSSISTSTCLLQCSEWTSPPQYFPEVGTSGRDRFLKCLWEIFEDCWNRSFYMLGALWWRFQSSWRQIDKDRKIFCIIIYVCIDTGVSNCMLIVMWSDYFPTALPRTPTSWFCSVVDILPQQSVWTGVAAVCLQETVSIPTAACSAGDQTRPSAVCHVTVCQQCTRYSVCLTVTLSPVMFAKCCVSLRMSWTVCRENVIFTARCTLVQSAVLLSYVVCPSVCPSVWVWRSGIVIT